MSSKVLKKRVLGGQGSPQWLAPRESEKTLSHPADEKMSAGVPIGSSMKPVLAAAIPRSAFSAFRFTLVLMAALLGCSSVLLHAQSAGKLYKQGQAAEAREDYDAAFENYQKAVAKAPNDLRYRESLYRVRLSASGLHLTRGRKLLLAGDEQGALAEFLRSFEIDPGNEAAQQEIDRLRAHQAAAAPPSPQPRPELPAEQQEIEAMARP